MITHLGGKRVLPLFSISYSRKDTEISRPAPVHSGNFEHTRTNDFTSHRSEGVLWHFLMDIPLLYDAFLEGRNQIF
jgi:hypothetical protein